MSFVVSQRIEPAGHSEVVSDERIIIADDVSLKATFSRPLAARGVVVLLHAASAERFGVQSRFTSGVLAQAGLATLQVDMLTPAEEAALSTSQQPAQDLPLLLSRVLAVVAWLRSQRETHGLAVGLFASRLETIPALMAAERAPGIAAVVSRGGCPDYAPNAVGELRAPTLLLIGRDEQARAAELAAEFFARHF
jgi:putative phosphoribosyl transferase